MGTQRRIAVIGLGYVGLPVAVAFAERFPGTLGFDIDAARIRELAAGCDRCRELGEARLAASGLELTADPAALARADLFVITVPTPVDDTNHPDLGMLRAATETVGAALGPGGIVVYESTVYPGVTETICGPLLEQVSGLRCGRDFSLAYSPERINPGDKEHGFERVTKVVAGQDQTTLELVAGLYAAVVEAGVHRAPSIAVAEAAKIIENTQRDLNIALMNELALIFDRLGIDTLDVLAAARTKWNFLPFTPGLVGGHCIGVDPYYLTARAEQVGVHPQVILAGRRINDSMGPFIAQRTVKQLIRAGVRIDAARVLVLGLTYKPDIHDIRNSRVPSIISELADYGVAVEVYDPMAEPGEVERIYGLRLRTTPGDGYHAVVLAVPHRGLSEQVLALLEDPCLRVIIDVKGAVERDRVPAQVDLWRL
ncbi:nucleotide sugar dehydrogenase [Pseudenhygromyxa sp. WMMC2535]|uniref:nucleotide sugar dehydrogenase n=1 Tax=Pseudenhygromyxa sp. WMMC2535 TaxID=2712867 RepID=UPI0015562BAE|nr:nucleotide sugar dehydrogenase [Pseudenhygromyxa sp. WMMC2535]NVB37677.1 nucleotide sugar dehydrogenase [Pseudenhygromyxa sp. WMMC2535]